MTETVPFRTGLSVDKQVHIYLIGPAGAEVHFRYSNEMRLSGASLIQ